MISLILNCLQFLFITSYQPPYLVAINRCVCDVLKNHLSQHLVTSTSQLPSFFDFCSNYAMNCATYPDFILAIFHATWLHASVGQFAQLYRYSFFNIVFLTSKIILRFLSLICNKPKNNFD